MKASTVALQDQLLASLRDSSHFLTTQEVCDQIGVGRYSEQGLTVYRRLAALAKQGRLQRLKLPGVLPVAWWLPNDARAN